MRNGMACRGGREPNLVDANLSLGVVVGGAGAGVAGGGGGARNNGAVLRNLRAAVTVRPRSVFHRCVVAFSMIDSARRLGFPNAKKKPSHDLDPKQSHR